MHNMHIIEDNLFQVTFSLTTWSLLSLAKLLPYGIEMIVQHLLYVSAFYVNVILSLPRSYILLAWVIKPRPVLRCRSFSGLETWYGHANKLFPSNPTSLIFLPYASYVIIKHYNIHIYGCVIVLSNIHLYQIVVLCLNKWFHFVVYCPYKSLRLPMIF